jgi:prepilin-type N-terminal cleavage/methylation domain-containing protein
MNKKGFTLMEIMIVVGLVSLIFSGLVSIMMNSDVYWKKGMNKVSQHEEARRIMDAIIQPLREASPYWSYVCPATCATCASSTHYRLTVSNESDRVVFYRPAYNDDGTVNKDVDVVPTPYIFRFWSANKTLQMKVGDADPVSLASGYVNNVVFEGSPTACDCNPMPCKDCRSVNVTVTVDNRDSSDTDADPFVLKSSVTLRDDAIIIQIGSNVTANSSSVEEPVEGEF